MLDIRIYYILGIILKNIKYEEYKKVEPIFCFLT